MCTCQFCRYLRDFTSYSVHFCNYHQTLCFYIESNFHILLLATSQGNSDLIMLFVESCYKIATSMPI